MYSSALGLGSVADHPCACVQRVWASCRFAAALLLSSPSSLPSLYLTMPSEFSSSAYIQAQLLRGGHSDTVNTLAFSQDGIHLASGGDDQTLIIWNALKGQLLYRLVFENAVDSVMWHPVYPETIIVGLASGFLFQLHGFSLVCTLAPPR